ncbi:carbohydrate ABC transporter permease [Paenibacillus sp.]|uniref:carbohydrate ABC transporter permease n=1 Tax=Paenibacillus sp. TaxID=58172 RepID=UPI002D2AE2B8|nr:carbohydrate ABC transporter permease [Paenibacillus sp.]HZG83375.1 carbohydrate ABC transporter permease [Paenibacillus sp.]
MANRKMWLADVLMLPVWLLFFVPFYVLLVNTFKTSAEASLSMVALPKHFTFANYVKAFENTPVVQSFFNTLTITGCSVALIVLFGAMAAYPVVFRKNKWHSFLMYYLMTGFLIPFQSILVPLYILMRDLQLLNKLSGMIMFNTGGAVFSFVLIMNYMKSIPKELAEAATVDGCSIFRMFWSIVLPLLKPVTVTAIIYHTIWIWNDFLATSLFINSQSNSTLVMQIYAAKGEFNVDWPSFLSLTVLTVLPVVVFFLSMQRYVISGLVAGAVKS